MSMKCPSCKGKAQCFDTRPRKDDTTWRRYSCQKCDHRWTTGEFIMVAPGKRANKGNLIKRYQESLRKEVEKELRGELRALLGFQR